MTFDLHVPLLDARIPAVAWNIDHAHVLGIGNIHGVYGGRQRASGIEPVIVTQRPLAAQCVAIARCSAGLTEVRAIAVRPRASQIAGDTVEIGVITQLLANAATIEEVEDAISAADYGSTIPKQIIGDTNAGRPIILVIFDQASRQSRRPGAAGRDEHSIRRIGRVVRHPIGQLVVDFVRPA